MRGERLWGGLAVTYGVVAVMQVYLAVTTGALWAVVLAAVCLTCAVSCAVLAWRRFRPGFLRRRETTRQQVIPPQ